MPLVPFNVVGPNEVARYAQMYTIFLTMIEEVHPLIYSSTHPNFSPFFLVHIGINALQYILSNTIFQLP
jgi:hypothetical protein